MRDDDITRRSLTDEIVKAFNDWADQVHVEQLGAVPIADMKLHPIEDEL